MSDTSGVIRPRSKKVKQSTITMAHGAGGRAMRDLIDDVFLAEFSSESVTTLEDQARLQLDGQINPGDQLAFTTDSFVVDPIFFPGGNIGTLAVCGTINDLAVGGARPLALSCSVILEEGLPISDLRRISASMALAANNSNVRIVTGDTKVVPRGAVDKIFINTAGVGIIPAARNLNACNLQSGDAIIVNSTIGEHGATVMASRGDLGLTSNLVSDCRPLNHMTETLLASGVTVRAMRDATRGGVAAVLNEFAQASETCCLIQEDQIPLKQEVCGIAEILGLDPLYLANEGLFVAVVDPADLDTALDLLKEQPGGESAAQIGEVRKNPPGVLVMTSLFGGERLVNMLDGEQLPRIC